MKIYPGVRELGARLRKIKTDQPINQDRGKVTKLFRMCVSLQKPLLRNEDEGANIYGDEILPVNIGLNTTVLRYNAIVVVNIVR